MINLLPTDIKDDIRAARANTIIIRYMMIITLAFLFIVAALYTSYTVLTMTKASAEDRIASNEVNVQASAYNETKQQVSALSANLAEARPLFDNEVHYSRVLVRLGQVLPAGTVLGPTTLTAANFSGTPAELTVYAKSTTEADQVQSQLQAAAPFLSQVTVKATEEDKGITGYPVSVKLDAVISKAGI